MLVIGADRQAGCRNAGDRVVAVAARMRGLLRPLSGPRCGRPAGEESGARRPQRWSAARANRSPPATRLAPIRAEMPIFAVRRGFVWSDPGRFRERWAWREAWFALVRNAAEVG